MRHPLSLVASIRQVDDLWISSPTQLIRLTDGCYNRQSLFSRLFVSFVVKIQCVRTSRHCKFTNYAIALRFSKRSTLERHACWVKNKGTRREPNFHKFGFLGYVNGAKAALKRMRPRDRGVIVHAGSALAYRGIPLQSAYCAAKHAIKGFHDSLRTELLHDKSGVQATMVQLPALNTPQFEWVRSRLPEKAQPIPPIYEPEFAAKALYKAAVHPKREYIVGGSSRKAVYGNRILPGLADRVLAKTGYASQQTGEPDEHLHPDNLYEPYPGDEYGAHGRFSNKTVKTDHVVKRHPIVSTVGAIGLTAGAVVAGLALSGLFGDDHKRAGVGKKIKHLTQSIKIPVKR